MERGQECLPSILRSDWGTHSANPCFRHVTWTALSMCHVFPQPRGPEIPKEPPLRSRMLCNCHHVGPSWKCRSKRSKTLASSSVRAGSIGSGWPGPSYGMARLSHRRGRLLTLSRTVAKVKARLSHPPSRCIREPLIEPGSAWHSGLPATQNGRQQPTGRRDGSAAAAGAALGACSRRPAARAGGDGRAPRRARSRHKLRCTRVRRAQSGAPHYCRWRVAGRGGNCVRTPSATAPFA